MLYKNKLNRIENIVKQSYKNFDVIKEINFPSDFDLNNSANIVNNGKGIEYLGELNKTDDFSGCIRVCGDYRLENKNIIFIGEENDDIYRGHSISRIMFNKAFDEDIFSFSFNMDELSKSDSFQFVSLFGDKHYNELFKVSQNLIPLKNVNNDGVNQCQILAKGKGVLINLYKGYERKELYAFEPQQTDVKVLINRKVGQILINGHFVECEDFFQENPKLYILFGSNKQSKSLDEEPTGLKDICFGGYEGYIYFKPIVLDKEEPIQKQFKIQIIAKGSPEIEVYNKLTDQWTNLKSINEIGEIPSISLRILMKYADRLYSLIVYKDNKTMMYK